VVNTYRVRFKPAAKSAGGPAAKSAEEPLKKNLTSEKERKNDATHRIALARDASPDESLEGYQALDQDDIEFVKDTLREEGPRRVNALVAIFQQIGSYERQNLDGRMLARMAKAGHLVRIGETLHAPEQVEAA
jgi:hypothetical protein